MAVVGAVAEEVAVPGGVAALPDAARPLWAGLSLFARPLLARLGGNRAEAVEAVLDPALERSRDFVTEVTHDPEALDEYRERLHDALESFMSDPLATPIIRTMEREELVSAAFEPLQDLATLAGERTVEEVDGALRRAVGSPLVKPVIALAGETDEEIGQWIARVDEALREALQAQPLTEDELDALEKFMDVLMEPSGDPRLVGLLPPPIRERLAGMRERVAGRRAAFRGGVRGIETAIRDGSVGRLVQQELFRAGNLTRSFGQQIQSRLSDAYASRGRAAARGSLQEAARERLAAVPPERRQEARESLSARAGQRGQNTRSSKVRPKSRLRANSVAREQKRAARAARIERRFTTLATKLLGTAPSESLQSILKETAVSLSMRPGTAKRLRSKIVQAFPFRRNDQDPFVTEAEFFQALSAPPVFNAREIGGMPDAVMHDASGRTWDDTLRRKLAMQGTPHQLEHYAQSMRQNVVEQMRPLLKQAHEAASQAYEEFQAQADERWAGERETMREWRDAHPEAQGGADVPPGTRVIRSAFNMAETFLGGIRARIDEQLTRSSEAAERLWGGAPAIKQFRERIGAAVQMMFAHPNPQVVKHAMHAMLDPGMKLEYDLAALVQGKMPADFEHYKEIVDHEIQNFLEAPPDGSDCSEECRIRRAQKIWDAVLAPAEAAFKAAMDRARDRFTDAVDERLEAVTDPLRPYLRSVGQEDDLDAFIEGVDAAVREAAFNTNLTAHEDIDAWAEVAERLAEPQVQFQAAAAGLTGIEPIVDIREGISTAREHIHERLSFLEDQLDATASPEALLALSEEIGAQVQGRLVDLRERIRGQVGTLSVPQPRLWPRPPPDIVYRRDMSQPEFEHWLVSRVKKRLGLPAYQHDSTTAELEEAIHNAAGILIERPKWVFHEIGVLEQQGEHGSRLLGALVSSVRQRAMRRQVVHWEKLGCSHDQVQERLRQFWLEGQESVADDANPVPC
mgnify:CR=1 FL=1